MQGSFLQLASQDFQAYQGSRCIMLELFTKKPVFQGNDEIHQLQVIFKIMGTPSPERWLGLLNLPWYELVKPREPLPNRFRELFQK